MLVFSLLGLTALHILSLCVKAWKAFLCIPRARLHVSDRDLLWQILCCSEWQNRPVYTPWSWRWVGHFRRIFLWTHTSPCIVRARHCVRARWLCTQSRRLVGCFIQYLLYEEPFQRSARSSVGIARSCRSALGHDPWCRWVLESNPRSQLPCLHRWAPSHGPANLQD